MSTPRDIFNQQFQLMTEARVEANKQAMKDRVEVYKTDAKSKAYADKDTTDKMKILLDNKKEWYAKFVEAMGKMSEFDSKNPLFEIGQDETGGYFMIGEDADGNPVNTPISDKQYAQYRTQNLKTIELRNLVLGGYLQGVKHFADYDPTSIERAKKILGAGAPPPSGVKYDKNGTVVIKDKNDGKEKNINEKTQEDLEDPNLDLEKDPEFSFDPSLDRNKDGAIDLEVQQFNKQYPTLNPALAGNASPRQIIWKDNSNQATDDWLAKHSKGKVGTKMVNDPAFAQAKGAQPNKGGIKAGSNVANNAQSNAGKVAIDKYYQDVINKKLNK